MDDTQTKCGHMSNDGPACVDLLKKASKSNPKKAQHGTQLLTPQGKKGQTAKPIRPKLERVQIS
jgi:hypothetical protein